MTRGPSSAGIFYKQGLAGTESPGMTPGKNLQISEKNIIVCG